MKIGLTFVMLLLIPPAVSAQQSPSFNLEEYTLNAGGDPSAGTFPTSASFRITLHSIGDSISGRDLSSASFNLDSSFSSAYPPPGEVTNLIFMDVDTLEWDAEKSVGVYHLYRELISNITGLGFGACEQQELTSPTTDDTDAVPVDDGYFYLVTAENRLDEEGTKGFRSSGTERGNAAPCP